MNHDLPAILWVGNEEFPMHRVPRSNSLLGVNCDGATYLWGPHRGIYLWDQLGPRHLLEIAKHEITHAINFVYGVRKGRKGCSEEHIARKHGEAWSQIFVDNPRYLEWLVATTTLIHKERNDA